VRIGEIEGTGVIACHARSLVHFWVTVMIITTSTEAASTSASCPSPSSQ